MAAKKNSSKPIDPSNFLWVLKNKLCSIRGVFFGFNTQQDMVEILQVLELKGVLLAVNFFSCTQSESNKHLMVPITVDDKVSLTNKYSLVATINHSSTLIRGHYCGFVKDLRAFSWYSCNNKLFFNVEENSLNNTTSYILFYRKV